jgi:DNA-binding LytR/AlgR family response regulator
LDDGVIIRNRFLTVSLAQGEIFYVEKELRKVVVHTQAGRYWEYCVMERILNQTDCRMHRCHHSLSVNLDKIHEIVGEGIILLNGQRLDMCRSALQSTKRAWVKYLALGKHR